MALVFRLQFDWLSAPDAVLMVPPQTLMVTVTAPIPGRDTLLGSPATVVQAGAGGGGGGPADAALLGAALWPGAARVAGGAEGTPEIAGAPVDAPSGAPVGSAEPATPGSDAPPDGSANVVELSTLACPVEPVPYL